MLFQKLHLLPFEKHCKINFLQWWRYIFDRTHSLIFWENFPFDGFIEQGEPFSDGEAILSLRSALLRQWMCSEDHWLLAVLEEWPYRIMSWDLQFLRKALWLRILGNQIFNHTQGDIHLYVSVVRSSGKIHLVLLCFWT